MDCSETPDSEPRSPHPTFSSTLPLRSIIPWAALDIRLDPPPDALRDSIASFGVLHPLFVWRGHLVAGFRRLRLAKGLGATELPVLRLPEALSFEDLFRLLLREQEHAHPLTPIEKVRLYAALMAAADKPAEEGMELLGLPRDRKRAEALARLCRLPRPLLAYLHRKRFSFRQALPLSWMGSEMLPQLSAWVEAHPVGASLFSEVITLLPQAASASGEAVARLWEAIPDKRPEPLRRWLHERRYPESVAEQKRRLSGWAKAHPPPFLLARVPLPPDAVLLEARLRRKEDLVRLRDFLVERLDDLTELLDG